ncbi:AAA family ATPase [Clostridium cochlearium]|uniref:ATP-binding protein n=1 Tax=Clostridium cochlearium TaxID=1494 RepID=A0A7Y3V6R7_CLOCO|nr:AAA family ATPase [Clostridium cochlearium]NOH14849.1 ATP-binding protein [Clostridium cochlearium]
MFYINKILINGFKSDNKVLDVDLAKPVSVLYGDNGCGKTTLLRIIHALLSHDDKILLNEKVKSIKIEYLAGDDNDNLKKYDAEIVAKENEDGSYGYKWDDINNKKFFDASSVLFGVNRGIKNKVSRIDPRIIERFIIRSQFKNEMFNNRFSINNFSKELAEYLHFNNRDSAFNSYYLRKRFINDFNEKNLIADDLNINSIEKLLRERYRLAKRLTSERVQKALFDTLSIAINPKTNGSNENDNIPDDFSQLLFKNKDRLEEALKDTEENTLRNQIIDILKNYDENDETIYQPANKLLCNLLFKMISELERDQIILNSVNLLVDIFNDQISSDKELVIDQYEAYIHLKDGNRHTLNELSSGERHLLTFLTIFTVTANDRNILMIDEPEISLNLKWQRRILDLLHQLAPKSQIIVASHSPAISSNVGQLVEMKVSEDK